MSFQILPEELVERILALCVLPNCNSSPLRPSWHIQSSARSTASVLLVNKTFRRIATPLFYKTLVLRSPAQLPLLLDGALKPNPELGTYVRNVLISGGYAGLDELVHQCQHLEVFDMTLDNAPWDDGVQQKFADSLKEMGGLKHLVIRKNAYLSQAKPKYMISQLTQALPYWSALVSAINSYLVLSC